MEIWCLSCNYNFIETKKLFLWSDSHIKIKKIKITCNKKYAEMQIPLYHQIGCFIQQTMPVTIKCKEERCNKTNLNRQIRIFLSEIHECLFSLKYSLVYLQESTDHQQNLSEMWLGSPAVFQWKTRVGKDGEPLWWRETSLSILANRPWKSKDLIFQKHHRIFLAN